MTRYTIDGFINAPTLEHAYALADNAADALYGHEGVIAAQRESVVYRYTEGMYLTVFTVHADSDWYRVTKPEHERAPLYSALRVLEDWDIRGPQLVCTAAQ